MGDFGGTGSSFGSTGDSHGSKGSDYGSSGGDFGGTLNTSQPEFPFTENFDSSSTFPSGWIQSPSDAGYAISTGSPTPPSGSNALDGDAVNPNNASLVELALKDTSDVLDVQIEGYVHVNSNAFIGGLIARASVWNAPCYALNIQDNGASDWRMFLVHYSGSVRTVLASETAIAEPASEFMYCRLTVTGTGGSISMIGERWNGSSWVEEVTHTPSPSYQINTAGKVGVGVNGVADAGRHVHFDSIAGRIV